MDWLTGVQHLRETRQSGVLVTVTDVRGHAPRDAGAKMVVGPDRVWGTVGGGNLEAVAIERSRRPLAGPETLVLALSDKAPRPFGVQCCGGEVTLLLEPLQVAATVAVFGLGHVGLELAVVLSRHELDLVLVDSRPEQLTAERLGVVHAGVADVTVRHEPVLPEGVLQELPPGAHVVVMTHDHAEDLAICEAALVAPHVATVGVIGSTAKAARFRGELAAHALDAPDGKFRCPIGTGAIRAKQPAAVAVSVAAELLALLEDEPRPPSPAGSAPAAPPHTPGEFARTRA